MLTVTCRKVSLNLETGTQFKLQKYGMFTSSLIQFPS
jgi:hypothetical protein